MTKRSSSKFQVCKNVKGMYKNIWGVVKSTKFRSIRISKQHAFINKQQLNKLSAFGKRMNTKQCLKRFYSNVSEKLFQRMLKKSVKSQSNTLDKFVSILESRVDAILYRALLVNSLFMARQLINHGFVYINDKQVSSSNVVLFKGDFLELKSKSVSFKKNLVGVLKKRCFKQHTTLSSKLSTKLKEDTLSLKTLVKNLNVKNRSLTPTLKKLCIQQNNSFQVEALKLKRLPPAYLEVNYRLLKIILILDPMFNSVYYPLQTKYRDHADSIVYSYNEIMYND